jgi:hypothetical protein
MLLLFFLSSEGVVVRGKQQGFHFKQLRKLGPQEDESDLSNAQWKDGYQELMV